MRKNAYHFKAGDGSLWMQLGPNTQPSYLGCHSVGDVDEPQGDIELIYCPDASGSGKFRVVGSFKNAPGVPTTTVTADITDELDELEMLDCPFTLFVHLLQEGEGRRDGFANFDRSFILVNATITSKGLSNLATRTPDDNGRSEMTFDLSAEAILRVGEMHINAQAISETSDITDLAFCGSWRCRTSELVARSACETGYASTTAPTGSPADKGTVLKTTNGATWAACAADPFDAGEDVGSVECIEMGRDAFRIIVGRGETNADPAEIAYSDDAGATWTIVEVGTANNLFLPAAHSLFALDPYHVWAGLDSGDIYFSGDAGLSWTLQLAAGLIGSADVRCIHFADEDVGWFVGDSNVIGKTSDGGTAWTAVTGPSAETGNNPLALFCLDRNRAWVGYDDGKLFFTLDGGTTWTERAFLGSGVGEVRDVKFFDDLLGYIAVDNASPVGRILRTIDGGYSWDTITTPVNAGINKINICTQWSFYVAGKRYAGTGYIAKGAL